MVTRRHRFLIGGGTVAIGLVLLVVIGVLFQAQLKSINQPSVVTNAFPAFPEIDTSTLTQTQKTIVALLEQEYEAQPNGTKYTEGADEDWCADFSSWIMKEAGVPMLNQDNGSWRIEDVPPIHEYYVSVNRFESAQSDYVPVVGDVVMYKKPSPFGNHINIVIKNDNGVITSVGGNESDKIRIQTYTPASDAYAIGYGKLPNLL